MKEINNSSECEIISINDKVTEEPKKRHYVKVLRSGKTYNLKN